MTRSAFENFELPESSESLSNLFDGEALIASSLSDYQRIRPSVAGDQLADNPFAACGADCDVPMLGSDTREQLNCADVLQFSTPLDNEASGERADYSLVIGTDGYLRLEPIGGADSMADGRINVEIDAGNKSLAEAIKNADKNLKEYVREMMSYWSKSNPNQPYPAWWQGILDSRPNLPNSPSQVPIERTPPEYRPTSSPTYEPPSAPQSGWQPDYRGGKGPGYGSGDFGGGCSNRLRDALSGSGDGGGYYGGGDTGRPAMPNHVPDYNDSTGFIARLSRTIMSNEGSLHSDGSPNYTLYNADDNGGISVGLRQWHAGGALPELLQGFKQADSQKFELYFQGRSSAQVNAMSSAEFRSHPQLVEGMKAALADPAYQKVQTELMENWIKREVKMGMDLGLKGETELATFVDIANQYGQSRANEAATIGKSGGDQGVQMNEAIRGSRYPERFACIERNFSTDVASIEHTQGGGNDAIVSAASRVVGDHVWRHSLFASHCEGGNLGCAASVSEVLQAAGYHYANDAGVHNLVGSLKNKGWQEVPLSQAQPGDVLWNSHHIGVKAPEPNMVFDNSSRSGQWSHRVIGSSGLSDGVVHALRPPVDGIQVARVSKFA